jgi:hypothetical protein
MSKKIKDSRFLRPLKIFLLPIGRFPSPAYSGHVSLLFSHTAHPTFRLSFRRQFQFAISSPRQEHHHQIWAVIPAVVAHQRTRRLLSVGHLLLRLQPIVRPAAAPTKIIQSLTALSRTTTAMVLQTMAQLRL